MLKQIEDQPVIEVGNVVNLADYQATCVRSNVDAREFTCEEVLYLISIVTARRAMMPDSRSASSESVTLMRDAVTMVRSKTDDGHAYITFYYDYNYDPSPSCTIWKWMKGDKRYISVFYNEEGGVYLEKSSHCLIDGVVSKNQLFNNFRSEQFEGHARNLVVMTQLLFARHKDNAYQIVNTWDTERHLLTAYGPLTGGHELLDWPYIRDLSQRFVQQDKWVSEEEVTESLAVGFC